MTEEDVAFVERVFAAIQHIDADASATDLPSAVPADATDRKVALLRSELRRRDRELARLARVWGARDEEFRQSEARVAQQDVELEAVRLRVQQLSGEVDSAQRQRAEREALLGRELSEAYDAHALAETEVIRHVASKESALHALAERQRLAEDAWNFERVALSARTAEWEQAYVAHEAHHRRVMAASFDEMQQLEAQIRAREEAHGRTRGLLRERELELDVTRAKLAAQVRSTQAVEHAAALHEQEIIARAHGFLVQERRAARAAADEVALLRDRVIELEEDLGQAHHLLVKREATHRRELLRLAGVARTMQLDNVRLLGERAMWAERARATEAALSEVSALGEATAHHLFQLEEKRRVIAEVQVRARDAKLADVTEEAARLAGNLADVTERLGQFEMDHAAEQARADELERALAESGAALRATEEVLAQERQAASGERQRQAELLARTEERAAGLREELVAARATSEQRELELAGMLETRDVELSARGSKLVELERALASGREDLQHARKMVAVRDERIAELQTRVRAADEQNVALETKTFRLATESAEKDTELQAREELLASLRHKVAQRDAEHERLDAELKKLQVVLADKAGTVERQEVQLHTLEADLGRVKEELAHVHAELFSRTDELAQAASRGAELEINLESVRADVTAGEMVAEQLRGQLGAAEHRALELRRALDESDGRLRQTVSELQLAGQRAAQASAELAELRELGVSQERELLSARTHQDELERQKSEFSEAVARLESTLAAEQLARQGAERSVAEQARDNGEVSARLAEARARIDELDERIAELDAGLAERDAQLAHAAQLAAQDVAALRVEAQRAMELQAAEETARADAQRMRQLIERAAQEVRMLRAAEEQRESEAQRLRVELEAVRAAHRAAEQLAAQARQEGEQRLARMHDLEQQQQRFQSAREVLERRAIDAEKEAAAAREQAALEAQGERRAIEDQLQKLHAELAVARKARADAQAAAQQSKAEAEQIKRLAAEKIRQVTAAVRASQPPQPAGTQPAGTQPAGTQPAGTQPAGTQPPQPASPSVPPRSVGTTPPMETLLSSPAPSDAEGGDVGGGKTVVVMAAVRPGRHGEEP